MVIIVKEGESIQLAVDNAEPGDTILVKAGVFQEGVSVPANRGRLRIIGKGCDETILDGTGVPDLVGFSIDGSSFVTIAGFTVRNFPEDGIRVFTNDNVVRDNKVTKNGSDGVSIDGGSRNLIMKNECSHNDDDGIDVTGTRNYVICNEVCHNGDDGIDVDSDSEFTLVYKNEVSNNDDEGVVVLANGCWIVENKISENHDGLDVEFAENTLVYGNECCDNTQNGFEVDAIGFFALRNKINDNKRDGVRVAIDTDDDTADLGLRRSLFYANEISYNSGDGFHGREGLVAYTLFLKNDVDENGEGGLDLDGSDFNRLLSNDIDDNDGPGIDVDDNSDNNVVDDNSIVDNHRSGIRLDPAANLNAVRSNKLRENKPFDIEVQSPAPVNNTLDLNNCENSSPSGLCFD